MADLTSFMSNFRDGVRPNRFRVTLNYPTLVGTPARRSEFIVKGAALPASTLGEIPVFYQGRQYKIPGDRVFEDWNVTMYNTTDFDHRNALISWSNAINAYRANVASTDDPLELFVQAQVEQLSISDQVLTTNVFYNLWPKLIGEIALDFATNDAIEEYPVTFSYSHFEVPNVTT